MRPDPTDPPSQNIVPYSGGSLVNDMGAPTVRWTTGTESVRRYTVVLTETVWGPVSVTGWAVLQGPPVAGCPPCGKQYDTDDMG